VPLNRELKRGLVALAVLASIGVATFFTVTSSASYRNAGKSPVAARLKQPR
jgi:hypothetical protein